jgi:hypothetical protein
MLNMVAMKAHQDPSTLFEQVSSIKNCYNTVTHQIKEEEELIAVIMGAAQKEYISVITMEQ